MDLKNLIAIASALDEPTFLTRYPHAGLIVRSRSKKRDESRHGREEDDEATDGELAWRTETKKNLYGGAPDEKRALRRDPLGQAAFEPLVKTDRNPFSGMITVGRATNNDVRLAAKSVSKLHAYFQEQGGRWTLRDSQSSFGTTLNGEKLPADVARPLTDGALITFGPDTECLFKTAKGLHAYLRRLASSGGEPGTQW